MAVVSGLCYIDALLLNAWFKSIIFALCYIELHIETN